VNGIRERLAVWDAPTRLFHWVLVLLIGAMWWTGENRMLDWHRLAGYAVVALLLFRLAWGVVGSTTARFASFVQPPRAVARYVRQDLFKRGSAAHAGHNPLGGWSAVAMLLLLLTQALLGFLAVDIDGLESGPFSYLVDFDTGRQAAELHELLFNVLLAVMALHVAAVIFYLVWRRDNLISPMISGRRPWSERMPQLTQASGLRALLLFAAVVSLVWGLIAKFGQA
jgi:cytochrome b